MKFKPILLFLIIFNFSFISKSMGEGSKITISPFTPEVIIQEIEAKDNAHAILRYIFKSGGRSKRFFDGMERGEEKWLALYPIFKSVSDAMYSMALDGGLARGIKNNPEFSLKMIYEGGSQAPRICGSIDEAWADIERTKKVIQSALTEINLRIKALNSLSSEFDYQNILNDCKDTLQKHKLYWENESKEYSKTK